MKKISVKGIRKFSPCYDPTEISGIAEDTKLTLTEWMMYASNKLTDADKVWLASKFMTESQCRIFAIWCARQCKTKNKAIKKYIDTIEKHYIFKTATAEELKAAYRAAYWADDRAVYRAAYWAAYRAADSAADRAAYGAADGAADREADSAARKKQIKQILKLLEEVK